MERHLKKVLDCLNIGCNKKAVQEVDRLPKNVRDLPVFKSLKALALIRMFKRRQAYDILNEISLGDKLDEVTIQTMTSCFKESLEVGRIVDLCEAAAKSKPLDQDVLCHLFMAYARVFNYKRQKEISVILYKNFPKKARVYTFWAIISLVMQAEQASDKNPTDRMVCLRLAEKMCEKILDDKATNEEIELFLTILRKQQKFEDEYRFLTGPILPRVSDHLSWYNRRRAFLCLELKMYSRAFKHYFPTLIQEYPDQLEYYQGLFRSAFLLDTEAPSQQQPVATSTDGSSSAGAQTNLTPVKSTSALVECLDIVEKQISQNMENTEINNQKTKNQAKSKGTSVKGRCLLRGPCIARAELFHLIFSNENTIPKNTFNLCKNQFASRYNSFNDVLLEYFQNYSRKIICFYDLMHMLNEFNLKYDDRKSLIDSIGNWIDSTKTNCQSQDVNELDNFFVSLNYHLLEHSIRPYKITDSREFRIKLARNYIDLYNSNRHLAKKNETEYLPIDAYCLLTINALMTNSYEPNDNSKKSFLLSDSLILSIIVMAEIAISNSPANHQLKLLLLKLYSLIGASKQCSSVIFKLDIKHFQIDTLGHLLNPVLYNTGNYNLARDSLETCSEFYGHGIRECFEGLTQSYKDARFSKVGEVTSVLRRLSNSLNFTQCILLKGIVSTIIAATSDDLLQSQNSFDPFRGLQKMFMPSNIANVGTSATNTPDAINDKLNIRDNRDFKVLRSLHNDTTELIKKRQLQTFEDDQLWLKMRYYIIRAIHMQQDLLAVNGGVNSNDKSPKQAANKNNASPTVKNHADSEELKQITENIESLKLLIFQIIDDVKSSDAHVDYSYLEPESTPLRWIHSIDIKLLLDLVTPLLSITNVTKLTTKTLESYSGSLEAIVDCLDKHIGSIGSLLQMKQVLLTLTLSMEFITMATTSLFHISQMAKNTSANSTSSTTSSQQHQQTDITKAKTIANQMINKTEANLTRLSNLIKNIDPKAQILDKITGLDQDLVQSTNNSSLATSNGDNQAPICELFDSELSKTMLARVKTDLIDSYVDSLREIENVCKRKIKLLKS